MDIQDGNKQYTLMMPGVNLSNPAELVLFRVDSILALRSQAAPLIGHPCQDIDPHDWEVLNVGAAMVQKALRWTNEARRRLLKCRVNQGGSIYIGFMEPRDWVRHISEADYLWLKAVCDGSDYHVEHDLTGMFWAEFWAAVGVWAGQQIEARPRVKKSKKLAKARRQDRRERTGLYE